MKSIKTYIKHIKTDEVHNALKEVGFCCMAFVKCAGTGKYSEQKHEHVIEKYEASDRVVKLEIVASDENVGTIVGILIEYGYTGFPSDGIIIISSAEVHEVNNDKQDFW